MDKSLSSHGVSYRIIAKYPRIKSIGGFVKISKITTKHVNK
jgi:hypothetical protein